MMHMIKRINIIKNKRTISNLLNKATPYLDEINNKKDVIVGATVDNLLDQSIKIIKQADEKLQKENMKNTQITVSVSVGVINMEITHNVGI